MLFYLGQYACYYICLNKHKFLRRDFFKLLRNKGKEYRVKENNSVNILTRKNTTWKNLTQCTSDHWIAVACFHIFRFWLIQHLVYESCVKIFCDLDRSSYLIISCSTTYVNKMLCIYIYIFIFFPSQFFIIILLVFIAEVAGALVILVFRPLVSKSKIFSPVGSDAVLVHNIRFHFRLMNWLPRWV